MWAIRALVGRPEREVQAIEKQQIFIHLPFIVRRAPAAVAFVVSRREIAPTAGTRAAAAGHFDRRSTWVNIFH
jgi:hypothetical protein